LGSREKRQRRAKKVKKAQARRRHAEQVKGAKTATASLPASLPRTPPNRFTVNYTDPEALKTAGPLVPASWAVPPVKAALLEQAGRPVPPVVNGHMLVDTGARGNCMALDVATGDLGLTPVAILDTYGVHGKQKTLVFEAQLILSIKDTFGNTTTIQSVQRVLGVKDMESLFAAMGVQVGKQPIRLIGLLGRDFLRHATLIYKGPSGAFEVIMDLSSMRPKA
jgi:hypothetical protein